VQSPVNKGFLTLRDILVTELCCLFQELLRAVSVKDVAAHSLNSAIFPMPRERRINVRAKADLKDRLRRACELTGTNESSLVAACVKSLLDYVESHGEITLPIMVVPKSALKKPGSEPTLKRATGRGTKPMSRRGHPSKAKQ
jgi:hypothetical protein